MSKRSRISERRIRNNRRKRQRELRRNLTLLFLTAGLILTLSVSFSGFLSNAKEQTPPAGHKYYTSILIHEGDTLWSIAGTYMDVHYTCEEEYIRELCHINSLQGEEIRAGMYLIVPYFESCGQQSG